MKKSASKKTTKLSAARDDGSRTIKLGETAVQDKAESKVPIQFKGTGSSGTRIFSGYLSEDYLSTVEGYKAADVFDKMRRSDSKIKKVLKAVKDPIQAANWEIRPADEDDPNAMEHAEFVRHCLFEGLDPDSSFKQWVKEAMTSLEFGFAPFEEIHKVVLNHPKFGSYLGLRKLAWRSPRTIHKFNVDPQTEELKSITQYAYGDLQRTVDIDANYLLLISIDREGANWAGVSYLRPCYGAWLRKQLDLKILAIGLEKFAIPTPVGNTPVQSGPDYDAFIAALEAYTSHETAYLVLPKGWSIDLKPTPFDATKVLDAIKYEDACIVDAFVANFLELAMHGSGGGKALSEDLSSFFLSGITQIADLLCESMNQKTIKRLIDLNYGPQQAYPILAVSGITDKAGIDLANAVKAMIDAKAIIPDDALEANLRKRFDFPEASDKGKRDVTPPAAPAPGAPPSPTGLSERQIMLAEKTAKHVIKQGADELQSVMRDGLKTIGANLVADLMREAGKLSPDTRISAVKKVDVRGLAAYKDALREALAVVAARAIDSARKDVPKAKKVKFGETRKGITLAEYDNLPPNIKRQIDAQSELLIDTQSADLKKKVLFQFTSSEPSTDSDSILLDDVETAVDDFIEGSAIDVAAGITSAHVTNQARQDFFEAPDVEEQIEAYQFVNADPVSEICQDLAGTVFAKDDPEADRYMPPLHPNCKSYIMPILSGNLGNRDITGLKPSSPDLDKYVSLAELKAK